MIERRGRRKPVLEQRRHEGELLQRGEPRHVQPGHRRPALEVVALVLDGLERRPPQAVQLEHHLIPVGGLRHVDVRLLPHADLAADGADVAPGLEHVQGQDVVARVRQPVP